MGYIISRCEAIENMRFIKPKVGKVYSGEFVVIGHSERDGGSAYQALVKLPKGEWTVIGARHSPNGNWAVLGYGVEGTPKAVLDGLVKLGAISVADRDDHISRVSDARRANDREQAKKQLKFACEALGIQPPEVPE